MVIKQYGYKQIAITPKAHARLQTLSKALKTKYSDLIIKLCDEEFERILKLYKNKEMPDYLIKQIDTDKLQEYAKLIKCDR